MDLTPPNTNWLSTSGDDNLMALVEEGIRQLGEYAHNEYGSGRSRGFFEPGGVAGLPRKKQRIEMVNMIMAGSNNTYPKKNMPRRKSIPKRKTPSLSKKIRSISLRAAETKNHNTGSSISTTHATQVGLGIN